MTDGEREWLKQFERALAGDYNSLTLRIPPRIRIALEDRLALNSLAQQIDGQMPQLDQSLRVKLQRAFPQSERT